MVRKVKWPESTEAARTARGGKQILACRQYEKQVLATTPPLPSPLYGAASTVGQDQARCSRQEQLRQSKGFSRIFWGGGGKSNFPNFEKLLVVTPLQLTFPQLNTPAASMGREGDLSTHPGSPFQVLYSHPCSTAWDQWGRETSQTKFGYLVPPLILPSSSSHSLGCRNW